MTDADLNPLLRILAQHAQEADDRLEWPGESWQALIRAGVTEWIFGRDDGGPALDATQLLEGYEKIASACLTTSFILSQREAAVRHLKRMSDEQERRALIAPLVRGETFVSVGLSQLTTSRQHRQPALTAQSNGAAFIFNGTVPWVTGAAQANHVVLGAMTSDNLQVLAVVPMNLAGIHVGPPLDLMALRGSLTAEIRLDNVEVRRDFVLAGPAERALPTGKGGAGGLETSCLALGLAGSAIEFLAGEARTRSELRESTDNLERDRQDIRRAMYGLAREGATAEAAAALRGRANSLVLRATQVALTAAKGSGFLRKHPAQRWARQALFFLVWSCPRPTTEATLARLAPAGNFECFLR